MREYSIRINGDTHFGIWHENYSRIHRIFSVYSHLEQSSHSLRASVPHARKDLSFRKASMSIGRKTDNVVPRPRLESRAGSYNHKGEPMHGPVKVQRSTLGSRSTIRWFPFDKVPPPPSLPPSRQRFHHHYHPIAIRWLL